MALADDTPTVVGTVLGSSGDVLVTITSAQETTGTITLLVKYDLGKAAGVTGEETVDLLDPVATKTFEIICTDTPAGPDDDECEIRHRGEADQATEDAANLDLDGILDVQADEDDATGSFHQVCLISSNLTHTVHGGFITWTIDPGPGSNATVNPAPNGQKRGGPDGIPCVRWSSGGVGSQTIVASYDDGEELARRRTSTSTTTCRCRWSRSGTRSTPRGSWPSPATWATTLLRTRVSLPPGKGATAATSRWTQVCAKTPTLTV